jgi:peptide/nickel transport system substrate-binding protein
MVIACWIGCRVVVLPLVVCACLGAGCSDHRARAPIDESGPPVRGGTLEIVGRSDVDHLATTSAQTVPSQWLVAAVARPLLAYPPAPDFATKTRPAPDLAVHVPTEENGGISADGLTHTFRLRRGVRWNSNPPREVTAHDVVRGFKFLCNPVNPAALLGFYSGTIAGMASYCGQFARVPGTVAAIREFVDSRNLEGTYAEDDFTVVFRLLAPTPDFLHIVAQPYPSALPVEYLDYLPDSPEFRQHTLSAGPYRLSRYIPNRQILLERNPTWNADTDPIRPAYVDRIRVRLGMDAQLQQLQIEAGTADLGFDVVPPAALSSLLAIGDSRILLSPAGDIFGTIAYLDFNHVGPNNRGALNRLQVRQAIALAVDKSAVAQLIGGPRVARPLHQAVPSSISGYRKEADWYVTPGDRGDAAAARSLLADAGFPTGFSLRLAFTTESWNPLVAQALQASLSRAGIEVRLMPHTKGDLYGRLLADSDNARRGEWDLALEGASPDWYGENNGRTLIATMFDGRGLQNGTYNVGGYNNPAVNALIDRAVTARTSVLAEQSWFDAAQRVMGDVALVPLVEYKRAFARSRRVRNCTWIVQGLNCDPNSLWLADAAPKPEGLR